MTNYLKKVGKWLGVIVLLFLLYTIIVIVHGTYTDYQPEGAKKLPVATNSAKALATDSSFTFLSWNLGYGGLGAQCNFFYYGNGFFLAGDKMVQPPEELVKGNVAGIQKLIKANPADFYLFQEVDISSKRSHYINQYDLINKQLGNYAASFAPNFKVTRVPIPVLEPWRAYGKAHSGLATFSAFAPSKVERHQLPGRFGWPDRIFQLDRCAAISHFPLANGKELIVINVHNSAYDKNGQLKSQQMAYLRDFLLQEYEKGNYIITGGDWNQCPPHFKFDTFRPGQRKHKKHYNIDPDFMPQDWQWIYDPTFPTSRSTNESYDPASTFQTLIDYYLLSPNLSALKVKAINHDFQFSDHQAVWMEVKLK